MTVDSQSLPPRSLFVLAAAGIPSSKLGGARAARLTDAERELYVWILRRFATVGRPSRSELLAQAGVGLQLVLESLAREDLVHVDRSGEIAVAYPFSGRPTAHRVVFPTGHEAYAMCAIDALGIAPMFDQAVVVASRDPSSGDDIEVHVAPDGVARWSPQSSVVVAGTTGTRGDSCEGCCPVLNFFASTENAMGWLGDHPAVCGEVITIEDAILAGRAVFGGVLAEV